MKGRSLKGRRKGGDEEQNEEEDEEGCRRRSRWRWDEMERKMKFQKQTILFVKTVFGS